MLTSKQLKLMERLSVRQQEIISELNAFVKDIERCEKTILDLKLELDAVNVKHQNRTTTREDIDYLTDLLRCAKKKLTWERHMASLQKRAPLLLQEMSAVTSDPLAPAAEEIRAQILQSLQAVQGAMERLQAAKV